MTLIPNWREGVLEMGVGQAKGEQSIPLILLILIPFPLILEICPLEVLDPSLLPGLLHGGRRLTTLGFLHNSSVPAPLPFQCLGECPFPRHLQLNNHWGCGFPPPTPPGHLQVPALNWGAAKRLQRESHYPELTPFPRMGEEWVRSWPWDDTLEYLD